MTLQKKSTKQENNTPAVDAYLKASNHPFKAEVAALREIIMKANSKLSERVKWNAPSFFYIADMAAFNLKQEKFVQLIFIFPQGLIEDSTGLLMGDWKDRREARFHDMKDVKSKKPALEKVVNDWVALMDKTTTQ